MQSQSGKAVLILGANSDVAKQAIKLYVEKGYSVIAASRSTDELIRFVQQNNLATDKVVGTILMQQHLMIIKIL